MASFLQNSSSDTSYGFNDDIKMRPFLIIKVTAVADEVSSDAQAAAAEALLGMASFLQNSSSDAATSQLEQSAQ